MVVSYITWEDRSAKVCCIPIQYLCIDAVQLLKNAIYVCYYNNLTQTTRLTTCVKLFIVKTSQINLRCLLYNKYKYIDYCILWTLV